MAYEQLGVYKYLAALDPDKTPRDRHRIAVDALADHDRRRRTALLDTLEEYLARRRSIAETARVLFIHPNTLRQRLDRIERVSGLDARARGPAGARAGGQARPARRRAPPAAQRLSGSVRLHLALGLGDRAQGAVELGAGERRQLPGSMALSGGAPARTASA